jgi:hypothetical protein
MLQEEAEIIYLLNKIKGGALQAFSFGLFALSYTTKSILLQGLVFKAVCGIGLA